VVDQTTPDEHAVVPFLRAGPPPDRTRWDGWQQWRKIRGTFVPAPRLTPADYQSLSPRRRALHDLHRTATHVNMRLQETPMSTRVANLMRGRLQNNAVKFMPGTRDGLMINGGGFQGKTETACDAAASFEDVWREVHHQLLPGPTPGTRDVFVPVAYCRLPVRATPKGLCKAILNVYGNPHPGTLDDLVRAVRDAIRDHHTTALLIDDITRLRLHREDDQDTLDLIRELMDLNVTLILIGVDIPGSGLLRGAYVDQRTGQWVFPDNGRVGRHSTAAATQTGRRFDMMDDGPGPERLVFSQSRVDRLAGLSVVAAQRCLSVPEGVLLVVTSPGPAVTAAVARELLTRLHLLHSCQQLSGGDQIRVNVLDKYSKERLERPDPGVYQFGALPGSRTVAAGEGMRNGVRSRPHSPAFRLGHGPGGQVQVERLDREDEIVEVTAWCPVGFDRGPP
jgi:hypothetical protein